MPDITQFFPSNIDFKVGGIDIFLYLLKFSVSDIYLKLDVAFSRTSSITLCDVTLFPVASMYGITFNLYSFAIK